MITLTKPMLLAAYDLLEETKPFCTWNLPASDAIKFDFIVDKYRRGECVAEGPDFVIHISTGCVGRLDCLMETMAHEMVHIHIWQLGVSEKDFHGPVFQKLAKQVCKHHGFDPLLF